MHRHDWKIIAKTFTGSRETFEAERVAMRDVERILYGVTTILWECQKCHALRKEAMMGKEINND